MPDSTPRLAAIYLRISKDREGAGLGVGRQLEDCRELAAVLGYVIVAIFTDNDISAYSGKPRPDYRKLMDLIRSGSLHAVITWHTDRLHRRNAELEAYIDACQVHGVITHTVKAGKIDLATPTGQMVARILGAVAQGEAARTAERVSRAHLDKARKGEWAGGPRRLGYEKDGMTVRESEALAVLKATREALSGVSFRSIAREWNDAGMTCTMGGKWTGAAVRQVLIRPRNAGLRVYKGKQIAEAKWPAIVPPDLWRALHVRVASAPRASAGPGRRYPGSGLYLCGVCGQKVTTVQRTTRGYTDRSYRCGSKTDAGDGRVHVSRSCRLTDAYVAAVILEWVRRHPELLRPRPAGDTGLLHDRLTAIQARKLEASQLHMAGTIDAAQLAEASVIAARETALIEAQIAAATPVSPLEMLEGAGDLEERWTELGVARQRAITDYLMTVTIDRAPKGRPKGWTKGSSYFDASSIRVDWKEL